MAVIKRDKLTELNRSCILAAAKTLFETSGITLTTVDDIAKKADCSKSTVYVYFRSKDEIFQHILYESLGMLRDRFKAALRKKTGFEERYFAICRTLTDFQQDYPLYFEYLMGEISADEDEFERIPVLRDLYVVSEELNVVMSDMLMKGLEEGCLRTDLDPISAMFTLWAGICGVIQMAGQKEKYFRDKLRLKKQKFLDSSFRMLLNSIKA